MIKGQKMPEDQKKKLSDVKKNKPSGRKDIKHSEVSKKKMSEAHKGKKHSEATKKKMSDAHKGKKGIKHTDITKKKISEAKKGKKRSEATKRKISEAQKGKPSGMKGKKHSEVTKQKMSDALKGKPGPNKGKPWSEASRKKLSATHQGITYDEWESFACDKKYCPKFNESCRESNRAKYNYECFICGKHQSENVTKNGKIRKLSVHHIDMDKQQGCDGHRWKLIPTCMNCHPGTHNTEVIARLEYLYKKSVI